MKHPYRLTKKIANPKPDRRHQNTVWASPEWEEGGIWMLEDGKGSNKGATLELRGHYGVIDEDDSRFKLLMVSLENVPMVEFPRGVNEDSSDSFRAFMMLASADPRTMLANLYFHGNVTMEELMDADSAVSELSDDEYERFYT